jgi:hypothetical protein
MEVNVPAAIGIVLPEFSTEFSPGEEVEPPGAPLSPGLEMPKSGATGVVAGAFVAESEGGDSDGGVRGGGLGKVDICPKPVEANASHAPKQPHR